MNASRWGNLDSVETAPHVVTPVEARLGPWTGSNNLGRQVQFPAQPNFRETILRLPESGPPRVRTVNLFVTWDGEVPEQTTFGLRADVSFGAGGTTHQFAVDWANGTQFSAPLNYLDVTAAWDFISGDLPRNFTVSALIGDGGSVHLHGATRTQPGELIASGATGPVHRIPAFAKRLRVMNGDTFTNPGVYDPTVFVEFLDNPTGTPYARVSALYANLATDGLIFPGRAKYARLVNQSIAQFNYYLQWELSL